MTSGQWTMGAMTKVNSCLPVLSLSPLGNDVVPERV